MKRLNPRRLVGCLLLGLAAALLLSPPVTGHARELNATGLDADSAVIKNKRGKVMSHTAELPEDEPYTVNYKWSLPSYTPLEAGDTMTVTVPANVRIPKDDAFVMKNTWGGAPIGNFFIAAGSHTGTVTLNKLNSNSFNRKGFITLDVMGATSIVDPEEPDVDPGEEEEDDDYTEPVTPGPEPITPPTEPETPAPGPTNPTEPEKPTPGPTEPTEPGKPGPGPTTPTEPGEPNPGPTTPTEPGKPGPEPTTPTEPGEPTPGPTTPTEPGKPGPEPTTPTEPGEPSPGPTTPTEPGKPGPEPTTPTEPGKPNPGPTTPTEPGKPNPGTPEPTTPTDPNDPETHPGTPAPDTSTPGTHPEPAPTTPQSDADAGGTPEPGEAHDEQPVVTQPLPDLTQPAALPDNTVWDAAPQPAPAAFGQDALPLTSTVTDLPVERDTADTLPQTGEKAAPLATLLGLLALLGLGGKALTRKFH
ncbi:Ig-like domain-containing protein [Levilactobacillus spicheri]|uniref:Gram-positive cocci surface proteins LPxTG domain-containing protein n=1 Tax=Levilactobacillus spicheri TaxID=216463 RepID=A0ABQ0WT07_9LACO|nr:Ig-like domain-containing protein [Levilactobacillus spicheri]GEO68007.1 hypothetical protein LSP04_24260 [Levilactobacillus spicheri]